MPFATAGYSNSLTTNRYDSANFQYVSMTCDEFGNDCDTLMNGHIRQSDQSGMCQAVQENKFAKVSVDGNEHSMFVRSMFQKRPVAGIRTKFPGTEDIMTLGSQPPCQPAAGASVHQKSHDSATVTADRLSPAITARA